MNSQAGIELISLSHISSQLLEWTDNRLIVEIEKSDKSDDLLCLHAKIGIEGLELAVDESPTFQKAICQLLGKLYLSTNCNESDVANLRSRASDLSTQKKLDLVCRRALEKYDGLLTN